MNDDLFFLPMITRALQAVDVESALCEALERIQSMGREPRYRRGYQQFLQFMKELGRAGDDELIENTAEELLAGLEKPVAVTVALQREGDQIASCRLTEPPCVKTIGGITSGEYALVFETGLVLWRGHVEEKHVEWAKAFPGEPFRVAADTGAPRSNPTRRVDLSDVGLVLRLYAGLEAGSMEIEWGA
jgi:hypothetical protein